jgi:hypothetical protein
MRDFTLAAYREYLRAIKSSYKNILTFSEYFCAEHKPESFCLIRHDVDRKPGNALRIAELENGMGVRSTYYFRAKPHTFKPDIIVKISGLRHEIGYHYESLSDTEGDMSLALRDFENNLKKLRGIVSVRTVSMHGQPLKPFDNRDMWRSGDNHKMLTEKYGISGEVYLDINYSDILYITDTGRNWTSSRANVRDKVASTVNIDFRNGSELLAYLSSSPHPRMVLLTHPERWSSSFCEWTMVLLKDLIINTVKSVFDR